MDNLSQHLLKKSARVFAPCGGKPSPPPPHPTPKEAPKEAK